MPESHIGDGIRAGHEASINAGAKILGAGGLGGGAVEAVAIGLGGAGARAPAMAVGAQRKWRTG